MADAQGGADRTTKWIRRIARIWGTVVIAITLLSAILHAVVPDPYATDYPPVENLMPLLMCISVAGLGIAWRWEGLGGAINILFFIANLGLYWLIRGRFFSLEILAILSLAIVPGILFMVYWWRTRSTSPPHCA